jgi:hypothetical protein
MPPLPPIANVLKMQCLGTNEGQNWANVFHALYTGGPPTAEQCALIGADIFDMYDGSILRQVQENFHLTEVKITDLTSDTSGAGEFTGDSAGGLTGSPMSAQVATCVSWPIARRYRGGHPRTYVPGPRSTDLVDSSHWKPAYLAALQSAAATFRTLVNAFTGDGVTTLQLGAVSYVLNNAPRVAPLFFPFVTDPSVHSRVDTQRRRLGRELT